MSGDWRPAARLETLRLRAAMLRQIRAFFEARNLLEVETPILSGAALPDPRIESFRTEYDGPGGPARRFLHTSPEFPMKRLLAAGSGPIYQICRVFRQGEAGRRHNPEFTMVEWYRPGWDYFELMEEVAALAGRLLGRPPEGFRRLTYGEAFRRFAAVDPFAASAGALRHAAERHGVDARGADPGDRDLWLDLLLSHVVEPELASLGSVFLYEYPASQAALARVTADASGNAVAERFELYVDGVEVANGFRELTDADEQRRRFEEEAGARRAAGLPEVPPDERLLAALASGMPECAGVAVGFDRLVMVAAGADSIDEVLAFPFAIA